MSAVERLAILITADGQGAIREFGKVGQAAERDLGKTESRADQVGKKMTSAGAVMMAASAVMVTGLWNAGQSAAQLEQAVGGTETVFKDSAGTIKDWAKTSAQSAGLSESAGLQMATRLGGALKGLGYDQAEAASKSIELTQVAADLAATYGGTTAEAVGALGAALRGEFDPAERFNLFLKQSTVDAKAVEMGLAASTSQVDANARAQATLALITEQSADAQGQFAREADTTSGQLAITGASLENLKAQIGAGFLPVMTTAGQAASFLAGGLKSADDATNGLASQILGFGSVALGGAGALSFLAGQVIQARDRFSAARKSVTDFVSNLKVTPGAAAAATAAILAMTIATAAYQRRLSDAAEEGRKNAKDVAGGGTAEEQLGRLKTRLEEVNAELEQAGKGNAAGGYRSVTGNLWDLATGADTAKEKLEAEKGALESQVEALEASARATSDVTSKTAAQNEVIRESQDAIEKRQNAILSMAGGELGLQSAQIAARQELETYNTAMRDGTLSADEREQAGVDLLQAFLREAEAASDLAAEQATAAGATLDAAGKAEVQKQRLEQLAGTLDPSSPLRAQLQGYIDKLNAIPPSMTTVIDVDTGAAYAGVQRFTAWVRSLPPEQIPVGAVGGGFATHSGGRAAGGPVAPWSVYRMHDTSEPEVLRLNDGTSMVFTGSQGGQVTNLGNAHSGGGSSAPSGGGAVVQLVYNAAAGGSSDDYGSWLRWVHANQGEVLRALGMN